MTPSATHSGTAGLTNPASLAFGPNGNLYILTHSTTSTQAIWEFDGGTGAFISKFGNNGGGDGTNAASTDGLAFDSSGNLWQGRRSSDSIIEFNSSGSQVQTIVDDTNLAVTSSLAFGPDGNLYVANVSPGGVARYNASTGQFMDFFVPSGTATWGLAFSGDNKLYVGFTGDNHVERYNATTGLDMGQFIASGAGGLNGPFSFAFAPEPASAGMLLIGLGVASMRRVRR